VQTRLSVTVGRAAHVSSVPQSPVQHWAGEVQWSPTVVHAGAAHLPSLPHDRPQHSVLAWQSSPAALQ
jgi:hypothetical protein